MNSDSSLVGVAVVITAGGTREAIDPVRYIGNRSSGKMGLSLASAAKKMGADVTLITTASVPDNEGLAVVSVESAAEMHQAVEKLLPTDGILIMAAAVADYRPVSVSPTKVKKNSETWTLELVPTVDILQTIQPVARERHTYLVGFAAETDDHVVNAQEKLMNKGLDLIVLNDVSDPTIGIGSDDNAVTILDANGIVSKIERSPKQVVANQILSTICLRYIERQ